jgi:hypothetical protein
MDLSAELNAVPTDSRIIIQDTLLYLYCESARHGLRNFSSQWSSVGREQDRTQSRIGPPVIGFNGSSLGDLRDMAEKPILRRKPAPAAIAEARENPGGWVYEIYGHFEPHEHVPASAIIGAWKVDDSGSIVGEFIPNPNFVVPEPDAEDDPPDP